MNPRAQSLSFEGLVAGAFVDAIRIVERALALPGLSHAPHREYRQLLDANWQSRARERLRQIAVGIGRAGATQLRLALDEAWKARKPAIAEHWERASRGPNPFDPARRTLTECILGMPPRKLPCDLPIAALVVEAAMYVGARPLAEAACRRFDAPEDLAPGLRHLVDFWPVLEAPADWDLRAAQWESNWRARRVPCLLRVAAREADFVLDNLACLRTSASAVDCARARRRVQRFLGLPVPLDESRRADAETAP